MKNAQYVFVPVFLFLILFLILSFFNRYSHDDLGYLKAVNQHGIFQATLLNYSSWNTRWTSILLANTFFYCIDDGKWIWIFHLVSIIVLYGSVHILFDSICRKCSVKLSLFSQVLFSLLFVLLFFFNTFSVGDVWFWLNASCMYLWNVSAAFFAFGLILKETKTTIKSFVIGLLGIYIGGSSEPFVLFIFEVSILFYFIVTKNKINISVRLFYIFIICIAAAFAVSYFGNGNGVRSQALPQTTFLTKNFIFIKSFVKLWLLYMPQKLVGSALLSIPFAYLGSQHVHKSNTNQLRDVFFYFSLLLIFFSALMLFFIVMIMSETGPERAWTSFSVLLSVVFAFLFFELGRRNYFTTNTISKAYPLVIILISSMLILIALNQYSVLKKYSQAYDMRMLVLKKLKTQKITGTVYLTKLPSSGLLRTAEISSTPGYFTNIQLKTYFDLSFDVAVK